jgi:hypothetical protein
MDSYFVLKIVFCAFVAIPILIIGIVFLRSIVRDLKIKKAEFIEENRRREFRG